MSVLSRRIAAPLSAFALLGLASCSKPVPAGNPRSSEFYWTAARETWAAGDYVKTADHLDHLLEDHNEYSARAIPWSLVLTSGMAGGYIDLADHYAAGARARKANGLEFRRKATEYRTIASSLALRFAQTVDKLDQMPSGSVQLAFELPNGNAAPPVLLGKVANGIELPPADAEEVREAAIRRSILLTACLVAGAPNDIAKTEHLLSRATALTPRATFAAALSQMLTRQSSMYTRDKLDEPAKLASLKQRAQTVVNWAGQSGTAMLIDPRKVGQ